MHGIFLSAEGSADDAAPPGRDVIFDSYFAVDWWTNTRPCVPFTLFPAQSMVPYMVPNDFFPQKKPQIK